MDSPISDKQIAIAEQVRKACVEAAVAGYEDASISGLCAEGALEAAISAMERIDLEEILSLPCETGRITP